MREYVVFYLGAGMLICAKCHYEFSSRKLIMELPYDPGVPVLYICQREQTEPIIEPYAY